MTTPQPQPMKRYELMVATMDNPEGEWVRHDDPALVAAREAMEAAREWFSKMYGDDDELTEQLRLALAGLKGPA